MTMRQPINFNDPLLAEVMRNQLSSFATRFGRKPTPDEPLFFCWHSTTPQPQPMCDLCKAEFEHALIEGARMSGVDPARLLQAVGMSDPLGSLTTMN
jgi:hypothetical protein